jgi:hypothetical protein
MKVTAIVNLQIEIQGLKIEITCRVMKNLAFDLILGIDFPKQTQACIDIQTDRLILQKYGVTVPLVEAKSHSQGKAASNSRIKQAKRSTYIAVVAPIILGDKWQPKAPIIPEKLPSIAERRKDLEENGVNFQKVSLKGQELDRLITLI